MCSLRSMLEIAMARSHQKSCNGHMPREPLSRVTSGQRNRNLTPTQDAWLRVIRPAMLTSSVSHENGQYRSRTVKDTAAEW